MNDCPYQLLKITEHPIKETEIRRKVESPEMGAIAVFHGITRNQARGKAVKHLIYEAYAPMAVKQMRVIVDEIYEKWKLDHVAMIHRIGRLEVGETSVIIAVAAPHRNEAFEACRFAIDRLKKIVPIWKKEFTEDGEVWVEEEIADRTSNVEVN